MKKTIFILLAVLLVQKGHAVTATPGVTDELRSAYEKAEDYFKKKKYKEAKEILNKVVAKASPLADYVPKARLMLANLQDDFTVSINQFQSLAVEYNNRPEGEQAQKDLGARYYLADKYKEAADSYKEFIQSYPKSESLPEAHYWLGCSLSASDKDNDAVEEYKKALEAAPDSQWAPKSLLGMGNAYLKMKKYGDAEKQYLKILDQYHLYNELNLVYWRLGQAYEAEKKYKEAHGAFQSLVDNYPKSLEVSDAKSHMADLEKAHPDLPQTMAAFQPAPTDTPIPPQPQPKPVVEATPTPKETAAEETSKPFHVQVGVFSKKVYVEKARKSLQKAGYASFVVTAKSGDMAYPLYKVRVGHFADRAVAEKVAKALTKKLKEKAIVVED